MKTNRWIVTAFTLLVIAGVAWSVPAAFRASGGVRFAANATEGTTGTAANPVIFGDAETPPQPRWSEGTHTGASSDYIPVATSQGTAGQCLQSGGAGALSSWGACGATAWPLQNGTNQWTANSGLAAGATPAFKFTTTNSFSGNAVWEIDTNSQPIVILTPTGGGGPIENFYDTTGTFLSGLKYTAMQVQVLPASGGSLLSTEYDGVSQAVAFSATPNFNCTTPNGETVLVLTVTGNITGATMTSGHVGQRCKVDFLKDATAGTYTIAFTGSNVRAQAGIAFTAAASKLVTVSFHWNDQLATAAWVQDAPFVAGL